MDAVPGSGNSKGKQEVAPVLPVQETGTKISDCSTLGGSEDTEAEGRTQCCQTWDTLVRQGLQGNYR